jgi:hypothetical protein
LWLKDVKIRPYPEKKIPTISAKESAMIPLARYQIYKFHIKKLDDKKKTFDSGIIAVFQVTNVSSRSDMHPTISKNRYYGYLNDIIECDFNSFKLVLFDVKWYMLQMNEHDPKRTVIEHANGFTMVNTRTFEPGTKTYVLPRKCEQGILFIGSR